MELDSLYTLGRMLKYMGWAFMPALLFPLAQLIMPKVKLWQDVNLAMISFIDSVNVRLGEIVKWFLLIMVVTTIMSIVGLSIFGISNTKLDEVPIYLHACLILLGSAATLLAGQHVRVDILHSQYSAQQRARLDVIGFYIFVMPVCLILIWTSQSFVSQSWVTFEGSPESDGLQVVFIIKTFISLFALTMLAQGLSISSRAIFCLQSLPMPKRPQHIAPLFEPHYESPVDAQRLYASEQDNHDWTQLERARQDQQEPSQ